MDAQLLNFGFSFAGILATLFIMGGVLLTPIFLILWIALQSEGAKKTFKILTIISALMFPVGIIMIAAIFYGFAEVNSNNLDHLTDEEFIEMYSDDVKEDTQLR